MAAETVLISSAIESLESWLHKKPEGFIKDDKEKLHSLLVGMANFGEDDKEKLYSSLVAMENSWTDKEKLYNLVVGMADFSQDIKKNVYNLVIGMAEFWVDSKKKLYRLLVRIADDTSTVDERYRLLIEMTDLWEDDDNKGKLNKEELHSLVVKLSDWRSNITKSVYKKKLLKLVVEMADLWKENKGKLNEEKMWEWVKKKASLWKDKQLFSLLLGVALCREDSPNMDTHRSTREIVEEIICDLRFLLKEGSSLRYLMSDVEEMARDAQNLFEIMDSVPFILFLELSMWGYWFAETKQLIKRARSIQNGLRETKERMLRFRVEKGWRNVGELEGGQHVVGLEEDIKSLLLHSEKILGTTICITGMTGTGKTTLARKLYNHANVVDRFECRAWVCVSEELSRKEILMKLIRQVEANKKEFERDDIVSWEEMGNVRLKQRLQRHLPEMRYFIVLDDVSDDTYLEYVLKALPKDQASRLLITTRDSDVYYDYTRDYTHEMKFLDQDQSWQLLLNTVFHWTGDKEFPKHLEKRGKQMLKKCNGLPLAIKELGRHWANKRPQSWEEVIESIDLSETLMALDPTYQKLGQGAKSCFLRICFFKEDTTIKPKKLLHILTIGGVFEQVQQQQIKLSECLLELKKAYIFEEYTSKNVRFNNIFHRLSIKKAEEEIGFEIQREDGNYQRHHEPRHRVIYCSREKLNDSTNQDKHLVSLFFFGGGYVDASLSYWKNFEKLHTLDMEDFGLKIIPDAVYTLIELRYLGFRNNYIKELPRSLSCLKKLEGLDIALNFTVEVSDIIWEMDSLRHLYMSDIICQKPLKIDALKNLETLSYIPFDNWTYEVSGLKMMTSLRRLGIEEVDENSDVSKLFASLGNLEKLDCLILRGFRFRSMPSLDELGILQYLHELKLDGRLTRLPSADNFPRSISKLTLVNSCLDEDPMPILEKLSWLEDLKLHNAYIGQQMVISVDGFCSLRYLVIGELWHLRNLHIGITSAMRRKLKRLEINNCPYLETLPEVILWQGRRRQKELKMVTTKNIATKIRKSDYFSSMPKVDLQP